MANEENKKIEWGDSCICIARVSTESQTTNPQVKDLEDYAKNTLGFRHIHSIPTTESGFLEEDDKMGWNLVTDYIKKHPQYKTIVCSELSRLSRLEHILLLIRDWLIENKIQLIVKDISFELLNNFGKADKAKKIVFSLYASLAAAEMEQKKDRKHRALVAYKADGYSIGGKRLFGYDIEVEADGEYKGKKHYVINEDEAKQIIQIYRWYLYGINGDLTKTSIREITLKCTELGYSDYLTSKRNVNKCLKEEAYTGKKITSNKKRNPLYWNYKQHEQPKYLPSESYECTYPPIFHDEGMALWNGVKARLKEQSPHNIESNGKIVDKSSVHTTILSKMVQCPNCGRFMVGEYRMKDGFMKHSYRCSFSRAAVKVCEYKKSFSMPMLDSAIWAFVKAKVHDIEKKKAEMTSEINVEDVEQSIENLQKKIDDFDDDIDTQSTIYAAKRKVATTAERKQKVKDEFENAVQNIEHDKKRFTDRIIQLQGALAELTATKTSATSIANQEVSKIEQSKIDMQKYVHLFVKNILPLYADNKYIVLRLISFENLREVFDMHAAGRNGELKIKGEKHDNLYYLCINKRNTIKVKLRLITDELVEWDADNSCFKMPDGTYNVEDVFDDTLAETNPTLARQLSTYVEELPFNRLQFYDEDNRNNQ